MNQRTRHRGAMRALIASAWTAAALVGWIGTSPAGANLQDNRDWSNKIWQTAMAGAEETILDLYRNLPDTGRAAEKALKADVEEFHRLLDEQLTRRREQYNESLTKLNQHLQDGNLRAALEDAMVAHEMALDPAELASAYRADALARQDEVLADPRVKDLIRRAADAARRAESEGRWLEAQALFYRLDTLIEEGQPYHEDLERVSRRLGLIRFYAPERLIELSNEYLASIGEEVRPAPEMAFDRWQDQLEGIDRNMVVDMMNDAVRDHLWREGWIPQITMGLERLRTLVTTPDLAAVFEGLGDGAKRDAFLKRLDDEIEYWSLQRDGSRARTSRLLDGLVEANAATVGLPDVVLLHEFAEGANAALDPFSDFVWPYELKMFSRQLDGSFTGVGIQIVANDAYQIEVVTPLEGTPAHKAGVRPGDVITHVDGRSALGITLNQAVDQITGPEGTQVTLTLLREGEDQPVDVTLTRATIRIDSVKGWSRADDAGWNYLVDPDHGIGYLRLTGFLPDTIDEFDAAVDEMIKRGARALILDVRFNPGGQLAPAVEICNRFVDDGLIVSSREAISGEGADEVRSPHWARPGLARQLKDLPVVVLLNQGSASASEIVAGCLRDHDRAVLIGTRSYGKGSVQKVRRIGRGEAYLRVTTEYYALPDGEVIHRETNSSTWGVEPHLEVRLMPSDITETLERIRRTEVVGELEELEAAANPVDGEIVEEGIDLQLEAAKLLLRSRLLAQDADYANLPNGTSRH